MRHQQNSEPQGSANSIVVSARQLIAGRSRPASAMIVATLFLWGCASGYPGHTPVAKAKIPLPSLALLQPATPPDCTFNLANSNALNAKISAAASQDAVLVERIKLEYERDCYLKAEAKLRERYRQLQLASRATVNAVKRLDHSDTN